MNQYIVKPGDTLSILATRLMGPGKTYHDLWKLNPQIANPDLIRVGDVIFYPTQSDQNAQGGDQIKSNKLISPVYLIYGVAGILAFASILAFSKKRMKVS